MTELAAAEIVRRAERCLGLAIRKGQEEGRIAKRGDIGGNRKAESDDVHVLHRPTDFAAPDDLSNARGGIYAMTDGVAAEHFEAAIESAKAEKNLSRANVVRKAKKSPGPPGDPGHPGECALGADGSLVRVALYAELAVDLGEVGDRLPIILERIVGGEAVELPDVALRTPTVEDEAAGVARLYGVEQLANVGARSVAWHR